MRCFGYHLTRRDFDREISELQARHEEEEARVRDVLNQRIDRLVERLEKLQAEQAAPRLAAMRPRGGKAMDERELLAALGVSEQTPWWRALMEILGEEIEMATQKVCNPGRQTAAGEVSREWLAGWLRAMLDVREALEAARRQGVEAMEKEAAGKQ
jgi:hypothetical protein